MGYPSVDAIQKALGKELFSDRKDIKKAAGRALGTLVELITYYVIREWGLLPNLTIERGLAEFANDRITHNVEFGLHPIRKRTQIELPIDSYKLPITAAKLMAVAGMKGLKISKNQLLSSKRLLRNACVLKEDDDGLVVSHLVRYDGGNGTVDLSILDPNPFAMLECKRVGVEDGAKKGPTTIEKAKQGAYVAKHVSALQKIRGLDGHLYGAMPKKDGTFEIKNLEEELRRLVYDTGAGELEGFVMTVGVVSNHGNWFTSNDPNKELLVLKQSYDWLLFLTDPAIAEFVSDTILSDAAEMEHVKAAFRASYDGGKKLGVNQFTKVRIGLDAHDVLAAYFAKHMRRIESDWFNVLAPAKETMMELKHQLRTLASKV